MGRRAKILAAPLVVGLAVLAVWLYTRSDETVIESPPPRVENTVSASPLPGGHGLTIEVFNAEGGRLWRLSLENAVMESDAVLWGDRVSADYLVNSQTGLVADSVYYDSSLPRLIFRGRVRLSGQGYVLTCSELTWEGQTRSFSVEGEYVLTRGDSIMRGQGLWASDDFKTIRSIGSTSGRGDL